MKEVRGLSFDKSESSMKIVVPDLDRMDDIALSKLEDQYKEAARLCKNLFLVCEGIRREHYWRKKIRSEVRAGGSPDKIEERRDRLADWQEVVMKIYRDLPEELKW